MRVLIAAAVTAALFATSALATDVNAPLAPGKPAGLKQAQNNDNTIYYVIGGAAIIAGIAVLASSNNGGNNSSVAAPAASSGTP